MEGIGGEGGGVAAEPEPTIEPAAPPPLTPPPAANERQQAPAGWAQWGPDDLMTLLGDEVGFLETLTSVDGKPLILEDYQAKFLADRNPYRWVTKARQVGFSFVIALEALARCHLRKDYSAHIVSFSQAEAKDKILIARRAYESLPLRAQRPLVADSKTELAFQGDGGISRIQVHPSKAPRGRNGDIYLDELAHYTNDRQVLRGSTALVSRSDQLTGCSTPLGRRGIFWEIAAQELKPHREYHRWRVPWWLCSHFTRDVVAAARAAGTHRSTTTELVERFGTPRLQAQFRLLGLEDFEQEFCCSFSQVAEAYLPYDLIAPCVDDELVVAADVLGLPRPEGRLVAGYDVGRLRDRSVLVVFDEVRDSFKCVLLAVHEKMPFQAQEAELRHLLETVPLERLSIDGTGLGHNLAENLVRDYPCVVRETFTNPSKERWATNVKILLQQERLRLPADRQLVAAFHAIRRTVSAAGNICFEAARTADGHADQFWAVALAVQREMAPRYRGVIFGARILG